MLARPQPRVVWHLGVRGQTFCATGSTQVTPDGGYHEDSNGSKYFLASTATGLGIGGDAAKCEQGHGRMRP